MIKNYLLPSKDYFFSKKDYLGSNGEYDEIITLFQKRRTRKPVGLEKEVRSVLKKIKRILCWDRENSPFVKMELKYHLSNECIDLLMGKGIYIEKETSNATCGLFGIKLRVEYKVSAKS